MVIIPFRGRGSYRGLKELFFLSETVQLCTEVIYLGLTLDKGLTWKTQWDKVMNKIYRAFWTCRRTFGKLGN